MTFSKYACWKPEMIRKVMDVEATQPEDHIFLATHSPLKMYRQSLTEIDSKVVYDEEQFLQDFLATPDFAFVPVLGNSGTGKSHLIRWLYTRIRSIRKAPDYRVLLVPKVGTNLRDIIGLILEDMEGDEFDEYRNRLQRATNSLTEAQAREQLLSNLAISVGSSGQHNHSPLSEMQSYLIDSLPALLFDPFFRQAYWLKERSIIYKLVVHILGNRNSIEIIEERRQFSLNDLPREITDLPKASAQAREFYSLLVDNVEVQRASVDWLNQHLDEAITKVLNLGREDLLRLILDVRRSLARKGVELILLIEDFAKLQGIDREVLEAVLARPQQGEGEPPLCSIRTGLACTTGYFKGLIDTVKTRTDFSVNLDVETVSDQSLVTPADVQQLAVRYLNAVRLPDQTIRNWLTNADEATGSPLDQLPSACSDCEHQSSCHEGFGAVDGMGLYPFNVTALERMRERTSQEAFNPRTLIKNVLRHTLEYHRLDLEEGRFPSPLLLQHFGGSKLNAMLINDIQTKDASTANRREALLNLWTDGRELRDLPPEVHTAFDLKALGVFVKKGVQLTPAKQFQSKPLVKDITQPFQDQSDSISTEDSAALPERSIGYIDALSKWRTGTQLPQPLAQELRSKIFAAIDARIDWNTELILRSHVIDNLFKQRNITFANAATIVTVKDIELRLPLTEEDEDIGHTTIALQALLFYNHYQHWQFPDGAKYFQIYARKLEEWSRFVLQAIPKCSTKSGRDGDPVPAVVELLAIAGRMANSPSNSLEDCVNLLFVDLERVDVTKRSASWQKLFNALKNNHSHLREVLESRIPCTKGKSSRLQIIDTAQLTEPLQGISSSWQPQANITDISLDKPFKAIVDARKAIDELLNQAIRDERERHIAIYQQVVNQLGEDFVQNEVIETLEKSIKQAREAGLAGGLNIAYLQAAMEEFQKAKLKSYINNLKKIKESEDKAKLLPLLSSLQERPVEVLTTFLDRSQQFLAKVQENTQRELQNLRSGGSGELEASYQKIENSLQELKGLASKVKGEL